MTTERLVIEITGSLPDKDKYAILAAAQTRADGLVKELSAEYNGLSLTAVVKSVRPNKPKTGAAPQADNAPTPRPVPTMEEARDAARNPVVQQTAAG